MYIYIMYVSAKKHHGSPLVRVKIIEPNVTATKIANDLKKGLHL